MFTTSRDHSSFFTLKGYLKYLNYPFFLQQTSSYSNIDSKKNSLTSHNPYHPQKTTETLYRRKPGTYATLEFM